MNVRIKITLLFTLIMFLLLFLLCGIIYYFSYINRLNNIKTHLTNRTLTTASLLSQPEIFDSAIISKINATTREIPEITNESIQTYNDQDKRIYTYNDIPNDTIRITNGILNEAKSKKIYFFSVGKKEAVAHYFSADRMVIIASAFDADGRSDLRRIKIILYYSFTGILLIAFISGWAFSKKLLQPVKKIADDVNHISAQNLAQRIESGDTNDEWNYLIKTLNELLDRLQESFEMQRRFISSASHELSTPLTSILSQLEVSLQRNREAKEYRGVMQSVYQDVHNLGKLTQTLLQFATVPGIKGGIDINSIRVDEILMQLPGEIVKMNDEYSVKLEFENLPENEERLLVFGNAELLFSAIKNVVSNSCKYSPDHRAIVKLLVQEKEIFIAIEDNGKGISENDLRNIFQPFYRSEDSKSITGFGVGLSLVHRIIKLHKGNIKVNSIVGKGTTVLIKLPIAENVRPQ
ncbi:MAG TPA: HAMP domain-containing sensor histidine kinase [Hanamia sp.]|nr:HAMP domain-containing sensor histidine kinase [Hanamia sp.]